jgi:starvation-inducible DNA-binding protein
VIAERVRKTGNTTLRSIGDIARRQQIRDDDRDYVDPQEMLAVLREDNLKLVQVYREARERAEEANDTATSSLADEWIDQAEERAWFLFEASRRGGVGPVSRPSGPTAVRFDPVVCG